MSTLAEGNDFSILSDRRNGLSLGTMSIDDGEI